MGIVGPIVGSLIGNCFGTGIVCSGVGVRPGVGMTGGARGIAYCRSLAMDSNTLFVVYP